MEEKKTELLKLQQLEQKPEEKYVTVTMPESSYRAFNCMIDYPITGWHERDETAMGRAEWIKNYIRCPKPISAGKMSLTGKSWAIRWRIARFIRALSINIGFIRRRSTMEKHLPI